MGERRGSRSEPVVSPDTASDFSGRPGTAVVTGGSGGIGSAVCILLASRGSNVAFTYGRNESAAAEVAAAVEAAGSKVTVGQVDVTDAAAVKDFVDSVAELHGGIHTAVSAAGPYVPMRYVSQIDPQLFREKVDVDLFGAFHLVWAALPHVRRVVGIVRRCHVDGRATVSGQGLTVGDPQGGGGGPRSAR